MNNSITSSHICCTGTSSSHICGSGTSKICSLVRGEMRSSLGDEFIRSLLDPVLRHNLGYFNHLFKSGTGTRTCALIVVKCVLASRSGTSVICSTLGACCWERSCDTILGISIITSIICGTEASGRLQNTVLAGRTGGTSKICTTHETRGWILSLGTIVGIVTTSSIISSTGTSRACRTVLL